MKNLQIANTFFEEELENRGRPWVPTLYDAFHSHPVFLQLQFLSALYASSNDGILISDPQLGQYWEELKRRGIAVSQMFSLSDSSFAPFEEVESWGYSPLIAEWAQRHHLRYPHPHWDVVAQVHSKAFSFSHSPKLRGAELIADESSARNWLLSFPGKKVFKTCFGVSGRGHRIVEEDVVDESLLAFLRKEFEQGRPVIAEPWVQRVMDFSTQWKILRTQEIEYIGSTLCENDARGQYRLNYVGIEEAIFGGNIHFLIEHKRHALQILEKMAQAQYFGNVGIDAMLYRVDPHGDIGLHPIVEINARKTMGWAALSFQRRYCPDALVTFQYAPAKEGFLPSSLDSIKGKTVRFTRNLSIK